ncbi:unnamed protein product [Heterosigma akashiwo]|uniref:Uncharacterized protein n=1 Tax=Heterosigma akashiwo TaxID=2829 RepID=A0A6V1LWG0_HETAK
MKASALMMAALGVAGVSAFAPSQPVNGVANQASTKMNIMEDVFKIKKKSKSAPAAPAPAAPAKKAAPSKKAAPAPAKKAASKKAAAAPAPPAPVQRAAPSGDVSSFEGILEPAGFWDPLGLSADRSYETLQWWRAAELKHGRVCMLACLGIWTQAVLSLPDPVFADGSNAIESLNKLAAERPQAIIQILLAIGAIEVNSFMASEGKEAGDLGFDPLGYKEKYDFNEKRTKELQNGRLAMLGAAGMLTQNALTGQGVFEQLSSGHLNPFGDGQGVF